MIDSRNNPIFQMKELVSYRKHNKKCPGFRLKGLKENGEIYAVCGDCGAKIESFAIRTTTRINSDKLESPKTPMITI